TDNVDGDVAPMLTWTSDRDGRIGTGRSISTSTLSTGDHRITASVTNSLGTTGTASITVTVGNGAPRITVTAPADGSGVDEGTTVTLTATATDAEDGDLTSAIAWASDLQGALGAGGTVSVRLTVVGTHHITATAADSGGQTRAASITVTVYAAPPVLTIVAPADGFSTSGSVTFSGTALDFKDGDRSNTIRWSSNVAGSLGTGATVTAARLAAGRHVITAAVTDSDNLTSTKTITIGVGNAPPRPPARRSRSAARSPSRAARSTRRATSRPTSPGSRAWTASSAPAAPSAPARCRPARTASWPRSATRPARSGAPPSRSRSAAAASASRRPPTPTRTAARQASRRTSEPRPSCGSSTSPSTASTSASR